jgi:hypothetical protein
MANQEDAKDNASDSDLHCIFVMACVLCALKSNSYYLYESRFPDLESSSAKELTQVPKMSYPIRNLQNCMAEFRLYTYI